MHTRVTTALTKKLERNLLAYVSAAGAAGVGMLTLSQAADAKVIYTPLQVEFGRGSFYDLDLNADGIKEATISELYICTSTCYSYLGVRNGKVAASTARGFASPLRHGDLVGSSRFFEAFGALMASVGSTYYRGYFRYGKWVNVKNRYLGLTFQINGETHYGWARMTVKVKGVRITGALTGYAYETVPNKPIIAGNRGSTTGAGPRIPAEPVSLGRLVLGAPGMTRSVAPGR